MLEDYPQSVYDREFPTEEAWFAPLAHALKRFAEIHNLRLSRYGAGPYWQFACKHPEDGCIHIRVIHTGPDNVRIQTIWTVDHLATFQRLTRVEETEDLPRSPIVVAAGLRDTLRSALTWQPEEWTSILDLPGYLPYMHEKEFREALDRFYPEART